MLEKSKLTNQVHFLFGLNNWKITKIFSKMTFANARKRMRALCVLNLFIYRRKMSVEMKVMKYKVSCREPLVPNSAAITSYHVLF